MELTRELLDIAMIALIPIGGILCFLGYHVFKFVLALVGLGLGGAFGLFVGTGMFGEGPMVPLAAVLGAGVGAWLTMALHFVGVFLIGAILGAILAVGATAAAGTFPDPVVLGIAAVVGGILALALQRLTITLTTAFLGAWGVVIGTTHVTGGADEATTLPQALLPTASVIETAFWWWLVLAVLGTVVQYRWSRKQVVRRPSAAAA